MFELRDEMQGGLLPYVRAEDFYRSVPVERDSREHRQLVADQRQQDLADMQLRRYKI